MGNHGGLNKAFKLKHQTDTPNLMRGVKDNEQGTYFEVWWL
jgi:ribosomal protein S30